MLKTLKKKKTESHQNFIVSYKKGVEALDELQDLYNNNEQKVTRWRNCGRKLSNALVSTGLNLKAMFFWEKKKRI